MIEAGIRLLDKTQAIYSYTIHEIPMQYMGMVFYMQQYKRI